LLYEARADSDPTEQISEAAPLPSRLEVIRPAGRYLPAGAIGRLAYGPALNATLKQSAQAERQLTQKVAARKQEIAGLKAQLQTPTLAALAQALSASLSTRPASWEPPPLALLQLVELCRIVASRLPGTLPPAKPLPPALREDRAQAELERWFEVRITRARKNADQLPPDIAEQAVVNWEALLTDTCEQFAEQGLFPDSGQGR
jgi:hypothetical protein